MSFVPDGQFQHRHCKEKEAWRRGDIDARVCVHCDTLTHMHHTQMIAQSNFKEQPPPFLEEIKRDLRVAVQNADHIVLMGYTLPPDDVDYRAFLAARSPRRREYEKAVKCSVVVGTCFEQRWFRYEDWSARLENMNRGEAPRITLEAARGLFGEENVRFYGGGIPEVFLEGGRVTDSAVNNLLTWEEQ